MGKLGEGFQSLNLPGPAVHARFIAASGTWGKAIKYNEACWTVDEAPDEGAHERVFSRSSTEELEMRF